MKLFIVHVGYYDHEIGIYELHTNFLVAAEDVRAARDQVKKREVFINKKMHIDAVQEIDVIDGYQVTLVATGAGAATTQVKSYDYAEMSGE